MYREWRRQIGSNLYGPSFIIEDDSRRDRFAMSTSSLHRRCNLMQSNIFYPSVTKSKGSTWSGPTSPGFIDDEVIDDNTSVDGSYVAALQASGDSGIYHWWDVSRNNICPNALASLSSLTTRVRVIKQINFHFYSKYVLSASDSISVQLQQNFTSVLSASQSFTITNSFAWNTATFYLGDGLPLNTLYITNSTHLSGGFRFWLAANLGTAGDEYRVEAAYYEMLGDIG
jgi:hypothetical protein